MVRQKCSGIRRSYLALYAAYLLDGANAYPTYRFPKK